MKKYYLGYLDFDDKELTQFFVKNGKLNTDPEEWVTITANTLEKAKEKYEKCFLEWQKDPEEYVKKLAKVLKN